MTYKIILRDGTVVIVSDVKRTSTNAAIGAYEVLGEGEEILAVVPFHSLNCFVKIQDLKVIEEEEKWRY